MTIRLVGLVFVLVTLQSPSTQQNPRGEEERNLEIRTCLPRPEQAPVRPDLPDLSRLGLLLDPLAPGGARPEIQEQNLPVPVNPSTVTLFPVSPDDQLSSITTGTNDYENLQEPDCRP
jgi:hypothetical protein